MTRPYKMVPGGGGYMIRCRTTDETVGMVHGMSGSWAGSFRRPGRTPIEVTMPGGDYIFPSRSEAADAVWAKTGRMTCDIEDRATCVFPTGGAGNPATCGNVGHFVATSGWPYDSVPRPVLCSRHEVVMARRGGGFGSELL